MSYFDQLTRFSTESNQPIQVIYDPEREHFEKWYVNCTCEEGMYYAYHCSLEKACHKLLHEMEII